MTDPFGTSTPPAPGWGGVSKDRVERLRDVHRNYYCSVRGVTLVEIRNHPSTASRNGRRAEAVECLGLKPCWEGRVNSMAVQGAPLPVSDTAVNTSQSAMQNFV